MATQCLQSSSPNSLGSLDFLHIANNPTKESINDKSMKVYKKCIFCGKERFTDSEWKKDPEKCTMKNVHNLSCGSLACHISLSDFLINSLEEEKATILRFIG